MMSHLISIPRFLFSLVLAPVVAAFVIPTAYCGWSALHGRDVSSCVAAFAGYGWYGLIPAAIATIVLGFPLALLSIRFGFVVSWQFVAGGAFVGLAAALSLWMLDRSLNVGGLAAVTMSTGALAALTVWLVGVRGNVA
jgi:hypothetical protein